MTDLSIVVLNYDTRDLALACLASVERSLERPDAKLDCEVIFVDNGSRDGSLAVVGSAFPSVECIGLPRNLGFAAGSNTGLARARGRYIALLNSDVELEPTALERAVEALEARRDAGAAGIQLVHADGRLQNSIHVFPSLVRELVPDWLLETFWPSRFPSKRRPARKPVEVESVLGAVLLIRREALERVGALPEDYFFFFEETDWCWQLHRAGYRVLHVPDARALHRSGASSKRKDATATRIEYHRSLYHFLDKNRSAASARAVMAVRFAKCVVVLVPQALLGCVSEAQRKRRASTLALLRWHWAGRPADWGLPRSQPL